jgi:hypothetical protein
MTGIREYVVSPVLVSTLPWRPYVQRKRAIELAVAKSRGDAAQVEAPEDDLTLQGLRTHKLLDTGLSGGLTGAVLNALKRSCIAI